MRIMLAVLVLCSTGFAGTIYTDQGAWEAALAGKTINALTLSPQAVPTTGGTIVDDELTLEFPANHGGIALHADGWSGDAHSPGAGDPQFNRFTFAAPIQAIGFDLAISFDGNNLDRISIRLDQPFTPSRSPHGFPAPTFFGWIGDFSITEMLVSGISTRNHYGMRDVRYVLNNGDLQPVPLPAAVWAGLALLPLAAIKRRRGLALHR